MSEESRRADNVLQLAGFKKREPPTVVELPQVYGRINAMNKVEYGLIGVSAADSRRLLNALMYIGLRLLEISE